MSKNSHSHKILILDFGSQTTQLIARRVREAGVYCELLPGNVAEEEIRDFKPNGIILSGGYDTVTTADSINVPDIVFEMNCPVLGICYGMQAMAQQLGGKVSGSHKPEFGYAKVKVEQTDSLLENIDDEIDANGAYIDVWMNHSDFVTELPDGFQAICSTGSSPYAGMAHVEKRFFGLQFHPEVTHTKQGERILSRFVKDICGCEVNWTFDNIIAEQVEKVREQVGNEKVLVGLSGGVDSAVVAALLYKAIGEQVTCVLVDTGLLRLGEADQVINVFNNHFGLDVICVDAKDTFLAALKGETDPEKKRKIIGEQFIRVFENESKKLNDIKWLAQGTIYPDVIESAKTKTGGGHVIKSHHNVGGLPEKMHLKLIEPLRELFKDEVRKLGVELGLPTDLVYRHPFPGPGLGVRIPGEIKPEYIEILQKADAIFIEELRAANLYDKVSQAFAVFLPIKSVGVKGDARHYGYLIGLRAVETTDFMTAHWAHLPYDFLGKVSNRIVNEIQEVSRVVYDISGKPPATIEWE